MGRFLSRVLWSASPCSIGPATSPRPDLIFAGALRGVAVKGGRRPSRSDLPLTAASTAPDSLFGTTRAPCPRSFRSTTATIPRGARHRARVARHELVFGRPKGRYHDAVMRIGGEAPRRRAHSKPRREGHSPTSGCRYLGPSSAAERQCDARLQQLNGAYAAGRSRRPAGVSPVVASRHNTMSSLRASATIIVLRVPPRPSDARFQNHSVRGLPF